MIPETTKKILSKTKSCHHTWVGKRVHFVQNTKMQPSYTLHWNAPSGADLEEGCKWSGLDSNDRLLAGLPPLWSDSTPIDPLEGVQRSLVCLDGLWAAILECAGYTSGDRTRLSLNGVCISGVDGYRGAVATDGHWLRFIPGEWAQEDCQPGQDYLIVPNEVIAIAKPLAKTLHSVIVYDRRTEKATTCKGWHDGEEREAGYILVDHTYFVEMQWMDKAGEMFSCWWNASDFAPYPNFRQIVPRSHATVQKVNCEQLRTAIKACSSLVSKSTRQIEFRPAPGGISFEYTNFDLGIKESAVAGRVDAKSLEGNDLIPEIGFNVAYLEQAIAKEREAVFKFNSPVQAVVIERSLGFCIVMPLRIAR